jgi:sodium-dependent dicarboxylate transporter 2/3/5
MLRFRSVESFIHLFAKRPWFTKWLYGVLGIGLAIACYSWTPGAEHPKAPYVAAMVALMAVWWIFEVIPIPVTSLFPIFLLPLFNITDMNTAGSYYGKPIIFLFLGGFVLAYGLQQSGLHKRMALHIVRIIGGRPRQIVLGFMLASGILSMWISNTAAVMVMLPIGLSILAAAKENQLEEKTLQALGLCVMLGMAYAADIGGMATIIGTPPNLVFLQMYGEIFPDAPNIGFLQWMMMALPYSIVFMAIGWFVLTRFIYPLPKAHVFAGRNMIQQHIKLLGVIRRDEYFAGGIFFLAVVAWISGSDIRISDQFNIAGWRTILGLPHFSDASVAIAVSVFLFLIPSKDRPGEPLLTWHQARKLPWGILLLFGGGFAIAGAFQISGLSEIIGQWFSSFDSQNPIAIVTLTSVLVTFLTELTSNTAMANLVLPILAEASVSLHIDPRLIMIPATLSASCAFMMPIASPTQAIVFGSNYVTIRQMMYAGIWFNLMGVVLLVLCFFLFGQYALEIQPDVVPVWAQ